MWLYRATPATHEICAGADHSPPPAGHRSPRGHGSILSSRNRLDKSRFPSEAAAPLVPIIPTRVGTIAGAPTDSPAHKRNPNRDTPHPFITSLRQCSRGQPATGALDLGAERMAGGTEAALDPGGLVAARGRNRGRAEPPRRGPGALPRSRRRRAARGRCGPEGRPRSRRRSRRGRRGRVLRGRAARSDESMSG
jgi:hypothetical protein